MQASSGPPLNLNPSMESWQKGLHAATDPSSAVVNFDLNNLFPTSSELRTQPQQSHKDEQKSFEFNLNMMNMIHNTLSSPNSLPSPSKGNASNIWSAPTDLNDPTNRLGKS